MKKAIIIFACMALLICTFCIASAAEDTWADIPQTNSINISAIMKILIDNGYAVDNEAPFESSTGAITLATPVPANTTLHSTITVADLIEDFDSSAYYYFYFTIGTTTREDPALTLKAGETILFEKYTYDNGEAYGHQLTGNEIVYLEFVEGNINQIANLRGTESTNNFSIGGTPATWIESADYETGYLYANGGDESLADIMTNIIGILVAGIGSMATGIGAGLSSLVKAVFCVIDGTTGAVTGLSTFGGLVVVFAGVSLAVGLSRWVVSWVTSLGASH